LSLPARKALPPAHFGYPSPTGVDDDGTVRANREGYFADFTRFRAGGRLIKRRRY